MSPRERVRDRDWFLAGALLASLIVSSLTAAMVVYLVLRL
jgi:hypothetical protein